MSNEIRQLFSTTFRNMLSAQGLSVPEFAKKFGEPETTVRTWARGTVVPRPKKLKRLADFFKISVEDLFSGKSVGGPSAEPEQARGNRWVPIVSEAQADEFWGMTPGTV